MKRERIYFYVVLAASAITASALFCFSEIKGAEFEVEGAIVSSMAVPRAHLKITRIVFLDVPFTSQAPSGRWFDPRQQNGCEEASAIMAIRWVRGPNFSDEESEKEIIAISEYERKTYSDFRDTSAEDTVLRIFKGYYQYNSVEMRRNINKNDIKRVLVKGNLVIVPVDGRMLNNPFYTPPGPAEHMIVVRGYDPATGEFITNDPGTRHGEGFRYREDILEGAIRDYPTGFHEAIFAIEKVMIVISR